MTTAKQNKIRGLYNQLYGTDYAPIEEQTSTKRGYATNVGIMTSDANRLFAFKMRTGVAYNPHFTEEEIVEYLYKK